MHPIPCNGPLVTHMHILVHDFSMHAAWVVAADSDPLSVRSPARRQCMLPLVLYICCPPLALPCGTNVATECMRWLPLPDDTHCAPYAPTTFLAIPPNAHNVHDHTPALCTMLNAPMLNAHASCLFCALCSYATFPLSINISAQVHPTGKHYWT